MLRIVARVNNGNNTSTVALSLLLAPEGTGTLRFIVVARPMHPFAKGGKLSWARRDHLTAELAERRGACR